jgi:hypothetical protein
MKMKVKNAKYKEHKKVVKKTVQEAKKRKRGEPILERNEANRVEKDILNKSTREKIYRNDTETQIYIYLSEFKIDNVRENGNSEKNYIEGRYGTIPYSGYFEKLFNQ